MRPPEERANDPSLSEEARAAARSEMARPTQATSAVPARQENIRTPTREDGNLGDVFDAARRVIFRPIGPQPQRSDDNEVFARAGRYLSGEGRREEGVGEIAYQSVPERDGEDVQWEGGPLSGMLNALPPEARAWLDAEGRAARIGTGFFLNANEEDRAAMIRSNVPTSQFRRDESGNLQVRFSRETPWAYINRPGVSTQDAQDVASIIARYMPAARAASIPSTVIGRAGVATGASAATEYASQEADDFVGGPDGADMGDVGMAGVSGGGGQLAFDALAAGAQVAAPHIRRMIGAADDAPLPPPQGATASAAYGDAPTPARDFAAERAAANREADEALAAIDDTTFNRRVPRASDPGQTVDDSMVYPEGRIRDDIRAALDRGEPVYISDEGYRPIVNGQPVTGSGYARRVQNINAGGRVLWADDWQPGVPNDGLVVPASPAPTQLTGGQERIIEDHIGEAARLNELRRTRLAEIDQAERDAIAARAMADNTPPPTPPRAGPATASDIYETSDEFGIPVSRGEASQDVTQRTNEYDMLFGRFGAGAQRQAATFQDQRADAIEAAGRKIATRGQDPLASNIDDAGQVIQNQVRERWNTLTQEINAAYDDAMTRLAQIDVPPPRDGEIMETVGKRLRFGRGDLTDPEMTVVSPTGYDPDTLMRDRRSTIGQFLRVIRDLQDEILGRNLSGGQRVRFSHVERIRQRLLDMQADANARQDIERHGVDLVMEGFDDWLGVAMTPRQTMRIRNASDGYAQAHQMEMSQQAAQAIERARALHSQRERLFNSEGAGDLGGRTMSKIRDLDTSGTQIINQVLGAGRVPPSQARASVARIREIANRTTSSGTIAPAGESTTNLRRFEGGEAMPAPELQALREALFMRMLEPLRTRGVGNQVPIQTIVNNLDTALNGGGRAITREMFTPDEVVQMERLLGVLRYYTPTTASRPTGVMAARLLGNAVDGVARFLTGAPGMLLRGVIGIVNPAVKDASGDLAARTAFSRPMLPDGLPSTQSGAAFGQLPRDYDADSAGVETPLDVPASTADRAYGIEPPQNAEAAYAAPPAERPIVSGDGGERTITIEVDGQFYNIPLIVNGQRLNVSSALRLWEEGQNPEDGAFGSEDEAVSAARAARTAQAAGVY